VYDDISNFVSVDVMVREGSSRVCVYDVFF
jgi:hypothetical protein